MTRTKTPKQAYALGRRISEGAGAYWDRHNTSPLDALDGRYGSDPMYHAIIDGYMDDAAGREDGHLLACDGCHEHTKGERLQIIDRMIRECEKRDGQAGRALLDWRAVVGRGAPLTDDEHAQYVIIREARAARAAALREEAGR